MKSFLILIIALSPFISLFAQEQTGEKRSCKREEIESRKIAFLSTEIGILPEEATAFWPVYNEFHTKIKTILLSNRKTLKSILKLDSTQSYSSTEMKTLIEHFASNKEKEALLQKEYFNKLTKVLPVEKVAKLIIAEEEFRRQMIHMWRKPHHASGNKGKNQRNR